MVAIISVPLKCMHVMPLTMHFASSCQDLNSDVKYKAYINLGRSIPHCVSQQIFT